jgi:starch synthase
VKVLSVASEVFPLIKTGGLADVVGALPAALAPLGVEMRTLVPGYPAVMAALEAPRSVATWPEFLGGPIRLLSARSGSLDLFVVDAPHLYERPGNPYVDASGKDWPDNAERFAALASAAARIGWGDVDAASIQFVPDLIHGHDWQAALVPVYLEFAGRDRRQPATVLTIHNIAFQGQFPHDVASRIGLPADAYASHGIEYFGDVGYLKGGILFADAITTVSPTYAREILTPENGMGMDAMLRWRGAAVSGIVNGIDTEIWNPATDPHLASRFDLHDLERRKANKRAVEARFDLPPDDGPLLCMVTRLTTQKGIDLVVDGLDALVELGARLVVLGAGDARFEQALIDAAQRYPTRVACRIGYDEGLSHLMQGGSDAILIPSRFEPCGLTQLYGLRYGCVPIVSRVGGLADTVVDADATTLAAGLATGIQFDDITAHGVVEAVRRSIELQAQPEVWRALQKNGMRSDLSWTNSARRYARLYESLPV